MISSFVTRIINKIKQETYRATHPTIWGKRCQINGIPTIYAIDKLKMGSDVSINTSVTIYCSGGVSIGDRVTLSRDVLILTVGLDVADYRINAGKRYRDHVLRPVTICDGVWIGARATICPGSYIGENSIIAAGAVVSGQLEGNAVYGGVPAREIKKI